MRGLLDTYLSPHIARAELCDDGFIDFVQSLEMLCDLLAKTHVETA